MCQLDDELQTYELVKCEYCGHTWDGNAQCQCTDAPIIFENEAQDDDVYSTQFDMDMSDDDNQTWHYVDIASKQASIEYIREHLDQCSEETLLKIVSFMLVTN